MTRIPFPIVMLQVETMFQKDIPEDNDEAILQHCELITEFIRACGYTEEEYLERWMQEQEN